MYLNQNHNRNKCGVSSIVSDLQADLINSGGDLDDMGRKIYEKIWLTIETLNKLVNAGKLTQKEVDDMVARRLEEEGLLMALKSKLTNNYPIASGHLSGDYKDLDPIFFRQTFSSGQSFRGSF